MRYIIIFLLVLGMSLTSSIHSQSYAFGIKGGPSLNTQLWNGNDREPFFSFFGDAFIETYDPKDKTFAFGASAGYHNRGSSLRYLNFSNSGTSRNTMKFGNIMLNIYAKQYIELSDKIRSYYHFGVRGEYNVVQDFGGLNEDDFTNVIQKFTYGLSAGGGLQYSLGELTAGFVELAILPDLSNQINIPQSRVFTDSFGNTRQFNAQQVVNVSIELSVGFYFVHIIEYID